MTDRLELVEQLPAEGVGAPPRANGELIFNYPWEGRAFGLAVALAEQDVFDLADFQAELIAAIGRWDALGEPAENYHYYECWLSALEQLIIGRTPVTTEEFDTRVAEFLSRPEGHDHDHDHEHGHEHDH